MTHPASRVTPDPRGQVRWPRGTPWHRRGPGPGRWAPEAKWGLVHDAIAAGPRSAEHAAMVDRANDWASRLDQSVTTPRAPRGRGSVAASAQAALNAAPGVAPWVEPDGWTPPRTPGGRIAGGPHSHSQTMFSVGGHSYWTMRDFLRNPSEVQASYSTRTYRLDPGLERAAKKMFEFTDPQTGMRAEVHSIHPSGHSYGGGTAQVSVGGRIYDASGRSVGTFTRNLNSDGSVYHAYFQMSRDVQGGGFKDRWFKQLMDQYALHGFDKVTVSANIDIGGYAWAQTGFDFETAAERGQFLRGAQDAMAGGRYDIGWSSRPAMGRAHITPKARRDLAELQRRHAAGEHVTALEISRIGKPVRSRGGRNAMWFGKRLMLGTSWHGVLQL